jgi:hypothetical protein
MIDLPHGGGGQFDERALVKYILASSPPRDYTI